MTSADSYYRLAPGIHVVPLNEGGVLFRTDSLSILIEGASARWLADRVIPLLDGRQGFAEIAGSLPGVAPEELRRHLDALVEARVLRRDDRPYERPGGDEAALGPLLDLAQDLGFDAAELRAALGRARVAVFGLEGHGAHLAAILARCGIGSLVLIDPYPCQPGNLALLPAVGPNAPGRPRQDVIREALLAQGGITQVVTGGPEVTRESVAELAAGSRLLVGCFDKGFSATNHWINRAGLAQGIPALYAQSRGHAAIVGPLVLPGQTACYMCYRMRSLACEDDFAAAMSYEEFLDRRKQPTLHERGTLPALPAWIAGVMGLEVLKSLLAIGPPSLGGKVLELDAFTLRTSEHTVLQKPDCPVCRSEKKNGGRAHPTLAELTGSDRPAGDLLAAAPALVSRRTGLVREFRPVAKDVGEPARPFLFSARLANHRFLGKDSDDQRICSGKGMSLEQAKAGALGEAVERYAAGCWDPSEVIYARRGQLDGEALDPRRLVLYRAEQIEGLPYVPYGEESVLGWVPARSLLTGRRVYVPALAVFLSYDIRSPHEYLFPVTSNGLASGPTLRDAVLAAACEVIERDAFLIAWLNRLPGQRLDPRSHPDPGVLELCEAHARRGVAMELYRLPTDHPCHVHMALGVQSREGEGPAVVVGLGADLDPLVAARKALLEVAQIRPALRRRLRQPDVRRRLAELVADPRLVASLQDHDLLYAAPESAGAFAFLHGSPAAPLAAGPDPPVDPAGKLRALVDHFRIAGGELLYVNLTPADLEALGLHAARVIIPDFQPIDFGWKERRLGGERLYELPRRLGLAPARTTPEQLNPAPHPIS
jgi:ribosomal protein S12 methylthiotransferase accessory factor